MSDAERLSKLLWDARESLEMFADVVEARTGHDDAAIRKQVADIDAYRSKQGWSPHGFGGEVDDE